MAVLPQIGSQHFPRRIVVHAAVAHVHAIDVRLIEKNYELVHSRVRSRLLWRAIRAAACLVCLTPPFDSVANLIIIKNELSSQAEIREELNQAIEAFNKEIQAARKKRQAA